MVARVTIFFLILILLYQESPSSAKTTKLRCRQTRSWELICITSLCHDWCAYAATTSDSILMGHWCAGWHHCYCKLCVRK
ncbi:hypothetical protein GUJ93_ZPchr0012g18781 [Zizania palustris]|uniref:Knottin scorpion toxin-like domain-containing protein n=1 Tax=Zizania palustris TaxID=103762 RepID=A0A8J5WNL8_ZIZPA|nr:hypothetical protein GUJ93_ZPchr0012g18781 [Zizania palustris]